MIIQSISKKHSIECAFTSWSTTSGFFTIFYAQDKSGELRQYFSGHRWIQHFTGETLARFKLPLPPLTELRQPVTKFENLQAETQSLESIYQQKLTALDELKKSLLHQAFSGEL